MTNNTKNLTPSSPWCHTLHPQHNHKHTRNYLLSPQTKHETLRQHTASYDQHIVRVLEKNESDDRARKMAEMAQLRDDLLAHAKEPKNSCDKMGNPIDPEQCSAGAAQYFSGEDKLREQRVRMQQAQMRQWTSQQIAEKNARTVEMKEETLRYDQYLSAVDQVRGQMEDSTNRSAAARRLDVRKMNEERAIEQAANKREAAQLNERLNQMEADHAAKSAFLNEETDYGKSALADYRVRPDSFKGYNESQVRREMRDGS